MTSNAKLLTTPVGERMAPHVPASPAGPLRSTAISAGRRGVAVLVLAPYLLYLATTPYERFPIVAIVHVERILVFLLAAACLVGSGVRPKMAKINLLWGALFCLMFVSYAFSPYTQTPSMQWWLTEYWKVFTLFILVLLAIRTWADLSFVIKTLAFVGVFYQFYSWIDFVAGGSYVYQQGMRRIVGVWSGGGLGAPNGFAILALFTLPSTAYCRRIASSRFRRLAWRAAEGLCLFTILYSGTRGGLVCAVFYFVVAAGPKGFKWFLLGAPVVVVIAYLTLPKVIWERHTDWITSSYDMTKQADRIAEHSAEGRIDGLVDGFTLALQRPVMGYGPNSSPTARAILRGASLETVLSEYNDPREDPPLALHNLWGQVASELGFFGLAGFVAMIGAFFVGLRRAAKVCARAGGAEIQAAMGIALFELLAVYTAYGMFSHTLYRYQWALVLALCGSFMSLFWTMSRREFRSKWQTS
jgi:O-antigen ligase